MSSHANRSGGITVGAAAGTIITRVIARAGVAAAAIVATLAMLLCTLAVGAVQAHAADAPDVNLGVDLGSGATGYTVENLHQNGAKEESLAAVIKWRRDALNDTSVKWDGKTMKQYLADNNISESDYLSPKWSNALERIAIQRAVEADDYNDWHIRPNGELPWTATYNGYDANSEILAWRSRSFAGAMDQWAEEKADWVNQTPGAVTGHYTTLIDPGYKAYGFGAASSQEYGSVYAGEATLSSGWDETPTNLQGEYTVEVNLSAAKLAQGVAANVPSVLTIGTSFKPVVKAEAYNRRYTLRGTWTSSNASLAAVQSDGSILGKAAGKVTLTFTLTDGTKETFPVEVSTKSIKSITPPHVTVDSGTSKPISQLPKTVEVTYTDGTTGKTPVEWDAIPDNWSTIDHKQHDITIHGAVEGFAAGADLTLTVRQAVAKSAQLVSSDGWTVPAVQTHVGIAPDLSNVRVGVVWSDGLIYRSPREVLTWSQSDLAPSRFATAGDKVTVHGTAKIPYPDDASKSWAFPVSIDVSVTDAEVKSVTADPSIITTASGTAPDLNRVKAKITYVNGDVDTVDAKWATPAKADYSKREGGTFTVNGTATVAGTAHDLTVTVKVMPALIESADVSVSLIDTPVGVSPASQLPKTAKTTWTNGDVTDEPVTWDAIPASQYATEGNKFFVYGRAGSGSDTALVSVQVTVVAQGPSVLAVEAVYGSITTPAGLAPELDKVKAFIYYADGSIKDNVAVAWDAVDPSKYATVGDFTATGTVTVNGKDWQVKLDVQVTNAQIVSVKPSDEKITVDPVKDDEPKPKVMGKVILTHTDGSVVEMDRSITLPDGWNHPREAHTVIGGSQWDGQPLQYTVHVNAAIVESVTVWPDVVETMVGTQPTLPKTAKVTWSNGDTMNESIAWNPVDVSKAGIVKATGKVNVDGVAHDVAVIITVKEKPVDPEPTPECAPVTFKDVSAATPHSDDIDWLACNGISTGWKQADGTYVFAPMNEVIRQDMAAFLYRLAGSPVFDETKAANPFTDVTPSTPHYKEILWLASEGISQGFQNPDGRTWSFGGDRMVVRQDMAAFLHKLAVRQDAKPALGQGVTLTDLAGASHVEDIQWLARTGVTTGWPNGDGTAEFRGMNVVVRQDMAAFLHRMDMYVLNPAK